MAGASRFIDNSDVIRCLGNRRVGFLFLTGILTVGRPRAINCRSKLERVDQFELFVTTFFTRKLRMLRAIQSSLFKQGVTAYNGRRIDASIRSNRQGQLHVPRNSSLLGQRG
jgi:hypothetical protein